MHVKWKKNKKLNPDIILDRIESIKKVGPDKKVSYSGFEYHDAIAVLLNMVDFPRHCDGLNKERIVSRAVSKVAKEYTLEKVKVLNEINAIVKEESATSDIRFHVLTSVSLGPPFPFKEMMVDGAKIRIMTGFYPKKYKGRDELISKYSNIAKPPHYYAKVIVTLKQKSINGAATEALRVLDILRSFWCLFGNSSMELYGDQWKPINKIRLGSAHTIHKESGEPASDTLWYEPNFAPANLYVAPKPDVIYKNCKWALKRLDLIPYASYLRDALLRYVRALDEKDQNVALIRLWAALEALTVPSEKNYDLVTRRCAFLFQEHAYHKQVLEHLREYRNSNVHSGDQNERAKSNCYQLQFYFYHLLLFHLRNQGEFSTLDEANSFLDLPVSKEVLENRKRLIEKAINFVQ